MDFEDCEPLTVLDYYCAEIDWRIDMALTLVWEILDELADLLQVLNYDGSPRPPQEFDPFQTIGKY